MMEQMLAVALYLLIAAECATLWCVVRGPTMPDRLNAGSMAVNILTFTLAVAGALKGSEMYYDAAIAAALLSFSSTIILAKFVATRRVL